MATPHPFALSYSIETHAGVQYHWEAREGTSVQELHLHASAFRTDAAVLVWQHIGIGFLSKGRHQSPVLVFLSGDEFTRLFKRL